MLDWIAYKNADGQWAESGAFILEASTNGSWVVRHKMGAIPSRASADLSTRPSGGLEGAKSACEGALREMLAAPNGINALASTAALVEQRAVTLALCKRYMAARALQREASDQGDADAMAKASAAFVELDNRVIKYLQNNR